MRAALVYRPVNRAAPYDTHNAEITLLNERLQHEYGSKTLSFKRDDIQSNADIDRYVDAVLRAYTSRRIEDRPPVFHLTNPYEEEIYSFRREKYQQRYQRTLPRAHDVYRKIPDRIERSKFIQYYNQAEAIFHGLEMLKAKYCQHYIPNGVQLYYKGDEARKPDDTLEKCDFCHLFESCYRSHSGIALSAKLIRRMDAHAQWAGMIRSERAIR